MTRTTRPRRIPSMTLHKGRGLARVRLDGRDVYLGPWGTDEAKAAYDRAVAEWLAGGRVSVCSPRQSGTRTTCTSVAELVVAYAKARQRGEDDRSFRGSVAPALRRLRKLYGDTPANDFTPARLDAIVVAAIAERDEKGRRLSRQYINAKIIPRIKRLFKWGARKGFVDATVYAALLTVEGIEAGTTDAPERSKVLPVDDITVEATIPYLPPVVRDMVQIQRLTGARPGEVCAMTWAMIERSGDVWKCRLAKHKTAHKGKSRTIAIGPRAQALLVKYLSRPTDGAIFSPRDNATKQREEMRAARRSKVTPSQLDRAERAAASPRRRLRDEYNTTSYGAAIRRAVQRRARTEAAKAGVEASELAASFYWHPNQLRHTMGTATREAFGLEAAQVMLGHSRADVTQVYAERDEKRAVSVARQVG